jgi:hypothetical protein
LTTISKSRGFSSIASTCANLVPPTPPASARIMVHRLDGGQHHSMVRKLLSGIALVSDRDQALRLLTAGSPQIFWTTSGQKSGAHMILLPGRLRMRQAAASGSPSKSLAPPSGIPLGRPAHPDKNEHFPATTDNDDNGGIGNAGKRPRYIVVDQIDVIPITRWSARSRSPMARARRPPVRPSLSHCKTPWLTVMSGRRPSRCIFCRGGRCRD